MGDKLERVVGVGEYIISNQPEDILKIYGLASCIGMVLYCPKLGVLALAHILLPSSDINPDLGKISPAYFVDTGVDALLDKLWQEYRCTKNNTIASIYGGSQARMEKDVFNIGQRNVVAAKQKLGEYGMKICDSDTGGRVSRTLEIKVGTGKALLKMQNHCNI